MPRGLGDNPLSKQRKSGSRATPTVASTGRHASAGSSRYNDVFFQKRSDDGDTRNDMEADAGAQAGVAPVPSSPVAAEAVMPEPVVPATVATADAPPVQEGNAAVEAATAPAQATAAAPVETGPQDQNGTQPSEGGFFKRLFGRFH